MYEKEASDSEEVLTPLMLCQRSFATFGLFCRELG